jgi:hypothetical protein
MKRPLKFHLTIAVLAVAAVAATAAPAAAIPATVTTAPAELIEPLQQYRAELLEQIELRHERELQDLRLLNGPYESERSSFPWAVERWRPVVALYFAQDRIEWALRIIACESGGDPEARNPHSSATGLFQHLGRYWPRRSAAAGWAGADITDPFANIAVAAWLLEHGGTSNWVCKARR